MSDNVNHPGHYAGSGMECIEAIRGSMTPNGFQDYCKGNVLKYIWRFRQKGGSEDLRKALVYLEWMIDSASEEERIADALVAQQSSTTGVLHSAGGSEDGMDTV